MDNTKHLANKEAIDKLKELTGEINICLFGTSPGSDDGAACRPMSVQKVCDQGNLWFFSHIESDKNKEIMQNRQVRLYFAHPGKGSYLLVKGDAEIIIDNNKVNELWTPVAKIWFKEGKDDAGISIIKVTPANAYYWDTEGNKMINFLKMVASVATGANLVNGQQGELKINRQ